MKKTTSAGHVTTTSYFSFKASTKAQLSASISGHQYWKAILSLGFTVLIFLFLSVLWWKFLKEFPLMNLKLADLSHLTPNLNNP